MLEVNGSAEISGKFGLSYQYLEFFESKSYKVLDPALNANSLASIVRWMLVCWPWCLACVLIESINQLIYSFIRNY